MGHNSLDRDVASKPQVKGAPRARGLAALDIPAGSLLTSTLTDNYWRQLTRLCERSDLWRLHGCSSHRQDQRFSTLAPL
ncbi:hypothetical protein EPA93_28810 [Ktedonosporobacter rubrisoli]|uniref:Uncharacterized protein n=1 Tax=Ktedonosporobacter rubrisoli TaxID=2509675 RepID=A0A4P6JWH5_KTERU|nr:hypothetical protein [Ktedonosporobacter rubrisoli]QBD79763.1 hypothetical protein EPA93_28810 [Ktedonosporobacter rubrisoli]